VLVGEVKLDTMSGGTPSIEAQLAEDRIDLSVAGTGIAEFQLAATIVLAQQSGCELPVGVDIPINVHLDVRVGRPSGTVFDLPFGCTEEALLLAPSVALTGQGTFASFSTFRVALLDEAGERMHAANASAEAQATVRLLGSFSSTEPQPASLAAWIAPAWPGPVEVVPELGAPLHLEVIDGAAITKAELAFHLVGAKSAMPIEDGETYGAQGWGATYNRIEAEVLALQVGEVGLCSGPSPTWFELTSETEETCEVGTVSRQEPRPGHGLDRAVRLLEDGTCTLVIRAPDLPAAAGLPASSSARFQNVEELWEF
jgi:hypothetical protein